MFVVGGGDPSKAVDQCEIQFPASEALLEITLVVSQPPSTNLYLGNIGLRETNGLWTTQKLALRRAGIQRSATLVLDQSVMSVALTRNLFGNDDTSAQDVTVTLHDETRTSAIEAIGVSPRSISAPAHSSLDFSRNINFFLNGVPTPDLAHFPPSGAKNIESRSIRPGGQAVLGLGFRGLDPGEYNLELKFFAVNSKDDDKQQKLSINVKVADSVVPAFITLVLALFVSFFAYKWLRLYQQGLGLQRRLADLYPSWLQEQPPFYSVVWARTVLRQTDELIHKPLLASPSLISERIDKLTPVLAALNEARLARDALCELPSLVAKRFDAVIAGIVRKMSEQNMNKAAAETAKSDLAALNADLAAERFTDRYWSELEKDVISFFRDTELSFFRAKLDTIGIKAESKASIDKVLDGREGPQKPSNLILMMDYEKQYAKVKILIERQNCGEFEDLVQAFDRPLDETFEIADDAAWSRIKEVGLIITPPINGGEPAYEAYQPLLFSITTGDKQLDETYIFRRGLRFNWNFEVRSGHFIHKTTVYHPETLSPRIVQFFPKAGTLTVFVQVIYEPRSKDEPPLPAQAPAPLSIGKSSDLKLFQNVERTERWSLVLAGLFAVISGLLTFYYKNPTFGTLQDYLMLFLWGVGVDQTKNFLQVLQSSKTDSANQVGQLV